MLQLILDEVSYQPYIIRIDLHIIVYSGYGNVKSRVLHLRQKCESVVIRTVSHCELELVHTHYKDDEVWGESII